MPVAANGSIRRSFIRVSLTMEEEVDPVMGVKLASLYTTVKSKYPDR
jgi:hypothetical protein